MSMFPGDIVVHSTRYRRALQSALALVWGLLGGQGGAGGPGGVGGAVAKESPSLAFCSTDCACPAADNYAKMVSLELRDRLESHPAIEELMSQLSKIVFQSASQVSKNPHILEDALLTYICHAAPLPCMERPIEQTKPSHKTTKGTKKYSTLSKAVSGNSRALLQDTQDSLPKRSLLDMFLKGKDPNPKAAVLDFDNQMEKEKLEYYQHKLMENADVNYQDVVLVKRNMDGDFNFNGEVQNNGEVAPADNVDEYEDKENGERDHEGNSSPGYTETLCVRKEQVTGLFAYTDWEMKQHAKSKNLKKASLLRAYGMIRHIVQYLLKMISEGKPKVVLFSGHDKTLQYLSLALGLAEDNFLHIHYASRMVIEIYRNVDKENLKTAKYDNRYPRITPTLDFYLRLVMNGRDVTNQLSFCRGKKSLTIDKPNVNKTVKGKDYKYYLCRIENIIRFTHEDYFSIFNATNFKDACIVH